jgi:hypothetical protein
VAATGFAASLTAVYRGMRDVMVTSGGFCARGGPYVVANECGTGQTALLVIGIFAMLVFGAALAAALARSDAPVFGAAAVMWAALFGSLGWNFLDLGFDAPGPQSTAGGWIVCGVIFWLMAAGGLVPAVVLAAGWLRRGGEPEPAPDIRPLVMAAVLEPVTPAPVPAVPLSMGARLSWLPAAVVGSAAGVVVGIVVSDAVL